MGDVAHELRTPLASLRTNLEVVVTNENASLDDYKAMIATQERALTRLERLVSDLLVLTTAQQPLNPGEVSPGALLEEAIGELQPIAATRGVALHLLNETDLVVPGDEGLLSRVFYNLIENGIHYTPAGGSVTITVTSREQWAVIKVTDTGIGIAAEDLPHIFERFYRVDASRSRHCGGAGLGLSIVSALVRQHHGEIEVESAPGQGSTFTVLLPLSNHSI